MIARQADRANLSVTRSVLPNRHKSFFGDRVQARAFVTGLVRGR
jgi:hypothetical protein